MTKEEERLNQIGQEIADQMECVDFSEAQEKREWDKVDPKLLEEFNRLVPIVVPFNGV